VAADHAPEEDRLLPSLERPPAGFRLERVHGRLDRLASGCGEFRLAEPLRLLGAFQPFWRILTTDGALSSGSSANVGQ
jgi:hypothetical protein